MDKKGTELANPCPKCGVYSYQGGYCLNPKCGLFRPSKHDKHSDTLDATEFMNASFGRQLDIFISESSFPSASEDEDAWFPKEGEAD